MTAEQPADKTTKLLYRPFGLVASVIGGLIASAVFKRVWQRATPGHTPDPPRPLESEYGLRELVVAALVQGAIYSVVKTLIDRGGARAFQRWTGEWPGD
jgi:hypothetical protein